MNVKRRWTNLQARISLYKDKLQTFQNRDCDSEASLACFSQRFLSDFKRFDISLNSASLAFFMIFSIFPLCLLITSVLSMSGTFDNASKSLANFARFLPPAVFKFIHDIFSSLRESKSFSFGLIGVLSLFWAASKGINLLLGTLYRIYEHEKGGKLVFLRRLIAIVLLLLMALSVLVLPLVLSGGQLVLKTLQKRLFPDLQVGLISVFSYLLAFAYLGFAFAILYHLASGKEGPFGLSFLIGLAAASGWLLISRVFGLLIAGPLKYSAVMGSLTGILALMLWLYFSAMTLLLMALIHKQILINRRVKAERKVS